VGIFNNFLIFTGLPRRRTRLPRTRRKLLLLLTLSLQRLQQRARLPALNRRLHPVLEANDKVEHVYSVLRSRNYTGLFSILYLFVSYTSTSIFPHQTTSHSLQYSCVCICVKREIVLSYAKSSSSPVKILARSVVFPLSTAISATSRPSNSRSLEKSCFSGYLALMMIRTLWSYKVSINVMKRRAGDFIFKFSCGTSRITIV
jgi:hypothetical protein